MKLTGYKRTANKRNGGIRSVALVSADAISAAALDASGAVSSVTLASGQSWATYHIKEDHSRYTEHIGPDGLVTHELTLILERMDAESSAAVSQLAAAEGVAAIVATNNDTALLVGWSSRFGRTYPLRIVEAAADSGHKLSDPSIEKITLRSVDADKAKQYTGL